MDVEIGPYELKTHYVIFNLYSSKDWQNGKYNTIDNPIEINF